MGTREAILEAALDLARESGPWGVTISSVSERAGVTKGALFHYFKTKEALLKGLLERVADEFDARLEVHSQGQPFDRAVVDLTLEMVETSPRLVSALLAAVVLDPQLAEAVSMRTDEWTRKIVEGGLTPARAAVIRSALDGLILSVAAGTGPMDSASISLLREGLEPLLSPPSSVTASR